MVLWAFEPLQWHHNSNRIERADIQYVCIHIWTCLFRLSKRLAKQQKSSLRFVQSWVCEFEFQLNLDSNWDLELEGKRGREKLVWDRFLRDYCACPSSFIPFIQWERESVFLGEFVVSLELHANSIGNLKCSWEGENGQVKRVLFM